MLCRGRRHEPLLDVDCDLLGGPLKRVAPAAGAGRLIDEPVARPDLDEVDLAGQLDLAAVRPEQPLAGAPAVQSAADPPRVRGVAVVVDRYLARLEEAEDLAHAAAAPVEARAA